MADKHKMSTEPPPMLPDEVWANQILSHLSLAELCAFSVCAPHCRAMGLDDRLPGRAALHFPAPTASTAPTITEAPGLMRRLLALVASTASAAPADYDSRAGEDDDRPDASHDGGRGDASAPPSVPLGPFIRRPPRRALTGVEAGALLRDGHRSTRALSLAAQHWRPSLAPALGALQALQHLALPQARNSFPNKTLPLSVIPWGLCRIFFVLNAPNR